MNVSQLQLVLEYQMTKTEAFAYGLALLYIETAKKYFPDYKHYNFTKGDPRKKELFKYCWKLLHETEGKLQPEDYRYYIQAQMAVMKNIRKGDGHPYIHPNCLVGEGAWRRWKLWKKYFDNTKSVIQEEDKDELKVVKQALAETHYALTARLGEITKESLTEALESKFLFRLVMLNVVSPYFIVLSPVVQDHVQKKGLNLKDYGIDQEVWKNRLGSEAEEAYKQLYAS